MNREKQYRFTIPFGSTPEDIHRLIDGLIEDGIGFKIVAAGFTITIPERSPRHTVVLRAP